MTRLNFPRVLVLTLLLPGAAAQTPATASPSPQAVPSHGGSQTAPPVSLPEVLRTLRSSPGWRGADLTFRAAELQEQTARVRAGLSLSAGASAALVKVPWDSGEWSVTPVLTANVSLPLLPWAPQREALRSAERGVQAAAIELRAARGELTTQAAQAYAAARDAAAELQLAQARLALAEQVLKVAQNQREQNLIPVTALLDRQAESEQARAAVTQAERGLSLAAGQLSRLLGQPVTLSHDPAAYTPLAELVPAPLRDQAPDLKALIARALTRRPEVARAQAALADAQASLNAAELDRKLPDLTASVQAGQLGSGSGSAGRTVGANFALKSGTLSGQVNLPLRETVVRTNVPGPDGQPLTRETPAPNGVALNLSAQFPLLGSPRAQASAQARLGVEQARLALDSTRQGIELEVRSRFAEHENARERLGAAQITLARAQTQLADARARLEAGLGTALDVTQAAFALRQAQHTDSHLQAQVALAALKLAQATGDLDSLLTHPGVNP